MTAADHAELKRLEGEGKSPVYTAAYDTIRKGAPGLSDATCSVLAVSINMKVAIKVTAPLLSEIEGLKAALKKSNAGFEEYERKFYLASDEVERLKLAICGGEDVPGSINAVSVEDCERFITEERGRHIDTEARLEYVRASRGGAAGRAHDLYMALAEVKEQVVTYPLSDNSTCMCGAPLGGHNVGSGHAPVSLADHAISLIVEAIDKALRFGAPTDGRPDDYEGPDVGMHDTEISERDDD